MLRLFFGEYLNLGLTSIFENSPALSFPLSGLHVSTTGLTVIFKVSFRQHCFSLLSLLLLALDGQVCVMFCVGENFIVLHPAQKANTKNEEMTAYFFIANSNVYVSGLFVDKDD